MDCVKSDQVIKGQFYKGIIGKRHQNENDHEMDQNVLQRNYRKMTIKWIKMFYKVAMK